MVQPPAFEVQIRELEAGNLALPHSQTECHQKLRLQPVAFSGFDKLLRLGLVTNVGLGISSLWKVDES